MVPGMRTINKIVIHCTATSQDAKVESIMRYWRENLGWRNPGYHILIDKHGNEHQLQPFDKPANGVRGHNADSIHISYIGGIDDNGKPLDNRTCEQKLAIIEAIKKARRYAGFVGVYGHRDFSPKACPSFDAKKEYREI